MTTVNGKIIPGNIVLDAIDASSKDIAPIKKDAGIKKRWSSPINIRVICGAISPINPIAPTNETESAVNIDINNKYLT